MKKLAWGLAIGFGLLAATVVGSALYLITSCTDLGCP